MWALALRCIARAAIAETSSGVSNNLDRHEMLEMEASKDNVFICDALGFASGVFFVHDCRVGDTLRTRARLDC